MLKMNQLVFDDVVEGTSAIYTDVKWNEPMGVPDAVFVVYIATQVAGEAPTLTLTAEMSPDGVTWTQWGASPVVDAASLTIGIKNVGSASGYVTNGLRYMRLKIQLADTSTPATRLQVYWIGRDFAV